MTTTDRFAHVDDYVRQTILAQEARTGLRHIPCADLAIGSTVYMSTAKRGACIVNDVRPCTKEEERQGHFGIVAVVTLKDSGTDFETAVSGTMLVPVEECSA